MSNNQINNLIFLDFDGTLVPLAPQPDQIKIPKNLENILKNLTKSKNKIKNQIYIITGRQTEFIKSKLPNTNISIIGLHGLEFPNQPTPEPNKLLAKIKSKLENFIKKNHIFLENKTHSLAFHTQNKNILEQARQIILENFNLNQNNLNILDGHNMFEIRPTEASKAKAALNILDKLENQNIKLNKIIYIGDDITDEEAMSILNKKYKNQTKLQTIRVLNKPKSQTKTCATQTFNNTEEVLEYLEKF